MAWLSLFLVLMGIVMLAVSAHHSDPLAGAMLMFLGYGLTGLSGLILFLYWLAEV